MSGFYGRMQGTASRLLHRFKQGTVTLTRLTDTETPIDADAPWLGFTKTSATYTLDAVVSAVEDKFVDGTTILATDRMVTAAAFEVEPAPGDTLSIDGKVVTVIKQMRIPAAGVVVAHKFIVRG